MARPIVRRAHQRSRRELRDLWWAWRTMDCFRGEVVLAPLPTLCSGASISAVSLRPRQQAAYQPRQPDLALALEPLRREDCAHLCEGTIDVIVEDDVVVFGPVTQLVAGV